MLHALTRFIRAIRADMERESREWMMQCPVCGRERSVRSAGGVRWKAWGESRILGRCSGCGGALRRLRLYRRRAPE